ncbi:hypothetical protein SFRURICE_018942 [Spodoptera frugiperda]|nr:hypothetical protein SFRURICE_018942 [Spodoptera frugiperda]
MDEWCFGMEKNLLISVLPKGDGETCIQLQCDLYLCKMEAIQSSVQSQEVKCSEEVGEVKSDVLVKVEDDGDEGMSKGSQRENRLTSIIDQLRCQSKLKEYSTHLMRLYAKCQPYSLHYKLSDGAATGARAMPLN